MDVQYEFWRSEIVATALYKKEQQWHNANLFWVVANLVVVVVSLLGKHQYYSPT